MAMVLLAGVGRAQKSIPPLFQVVNVSGDCQVKGVAGTEFDAAVNRKAYPFGSTLRVGATGGATIVFTGADMPTATILLTGGVELVVDRNPEIPTNVIVRLLEGRVQIFAEMDSAPEALAVETANFVVKAFTGESDITVRSTGDAFHETLIAIKKGGIKIDSDHFTFPDMRAGAMFFIETSQDRSLSRITCRSGEAAIVLENGTEEPLVFTARKRATVKIWRQAAPVGGREIVAIFAVGPDGKRPECYAFAVGQPGLVSMATASEQAEAGTNGDAGLDEHAIATGTNGEEEQSDGMSAAEIDAAFKELFGE